VIQTRKWDRFVPNHQATREDTPWSHRPLPSLLAGPNQGPNKAGPNKAGPNNPRDRHRMPRPADPKPQQLQNRGSKRKASGVSARAIPNQDNSPLVWKRPRQLLLCQNRGGKTRLSGIEAVEMPNEGPGPSWSLLQPIYFHNGASFQRTVHPCPCF